MEQLRNAAKAINEEERGGRGERRIANGTFSIAAPQISGDGSELRRTYHDRGKEGKRK